MLKATSKSVVSLLCLAFTARDAWSYESGQVATKVQHLGKADLDTAVNDPANPFWLLKFYAPWCGHCKQMAPVLDKVAGQVSGQMAIGKIDCTVEKDLCSEHKVRGYPTMKFSLDGTIHDYPGGRSEQDLLFFASKMNRPLVGTVKTVDEAFQYAATETDEGVAFLVYHRAISGDTIEDKLQSALLTQVYAQVARKEKIVGHFLLLDTDEEAPGKAFDQEGAFICRLEGGVKTRCYSNLQDVELKDLHDFVRTNNVATVTRLGPHNFNKVGKNGRPLVIGVVDAADETQVTAMKKALADYATNGPEAIRNKYYFGWFDGVKWEKFLSQFDVQSRDNPQIIVLDVPTKKFWQNATYALNIDDFLADVSKGAVKSKGAGPKGIEGAMNRVYSFMVAYRPWSIVLAVLVLMAVIVLILSCVSPGDDLRPPYTDGEGSDPLGDDDDEFDDTDPKPEEEAVESKKEK